MLHLHNSATKSLTLMFLQVSQLRYVTAVFCNCPIFRWALNTKDRCFVGFFVMITAFYLSCFSFPSLSKTEIERHHFKALSLHLHHFSDLKEGNIPDKIQ